MDWNGASNSAQIGSSFIYHYTCASECLVHSSIAQSYLYKYTQSDSGADSTDACLLLLWRVFVGSFLFFITFEGVTRGPFFTVLDPEYSCFLRGPEHGGAGDELIDGGTASRSWSSFARAKAETNILQSLKAFCKSSFSSSLTKVFSRSS